MGDRKAAILRGIGYSLFFLFFFVVFVYLGFPYGALKAQALEKLEKNSDFRVEIGAIVPRLLSGFVLRDVRIYHDEAAGNKMIGQIDIARIGVGLIAALRGRVNLSLDIEAYGGRVEGDVAGSNGRLQADVAMTGLDLSRYDMTPFLKNYGQFRLGGILGGKIAFDYDQADVKAATGTILLDTNGLSLADTKVYGMDLPALAFQPAPLELTLENRTLRIAKGDLVGDGMDVSIGGRMNLRDDLSRSNLNFSLKFKPKGELETQFGPMIDAVKKKDRDGFYRVTLSGTPARPRMR